MSKECWQLENLDEPTFCFQEQGDYPCSEENCAVEHRIQELKNRGIKIDDWWKRILPHSICQTSRLITAEE